jgi:hypothetical protein
MELEDESLLRGKTPKQALMKWLREHAREFGLTDDDGKPNETGMRNQRRWPTGSRQEGLPRRRSDNPPTL